MVGDRLDTDIAGAHEADTDSLLVMTGVSSLPDLARAEPGERPTWIGHDLTALTRPGVRATEDSDGAFTAGRWTARVAGSRLVVEGHGDEPEDRDAWWVAASHTAWHHLDRTGRPIDTAGLTPPGRSGDAE
jgi:glycerol-1-phosphatase